MGANSALLSSSFIQAGSSLGNGISQANAAKAQGAYQSAQATTNANLAEMSAQDAAARGDVAAQEKAKQNAQLMGAQRAGMASQGISLSGGSAQAIQNDTSAMGELDQMTIRNNAAREAMGYKIQSSNYAGQAKMATISANSTAKNSILTGGMNAMAFTTKGYGVYNRDVNGDGIKPKLDTDKQINNYSGTASDFSNIS